MTNTLHTVHSVNILIFVKPSVVWLVVNRVLALLSLCLFFTLKKKTKQNMVVDISLIPFIYFCLWTIQFKVGQDVTIAKCVSNKL